MKVIETGRRPKAIREPLRAGANCESIGLPVFRQSGAERLPEAIPADVESALTLTAGWDRAAEAASA